MGYALFVAQQGGKHRDAKLLTGFGVLGWWKSFKDHGGDTFRAVYTLICGGGVRASRLPEKIENGPRNAARGYRLD